MTTRVPPEMLEDPGSDISLLAVVPIGSVLPYAGTTAPSPTADATFLLCYGQAVSRAAYTTLFERLSTSFGAGDGSTTFNVPDLRGRTAVGKDNMGGSAASRITVGTAGFAGATLGAAGGDQRMHSHSHAITDPGHSHSAETPSNAGADTAPLALGVGAPTGTTTGSATTGISVSAAGAGNSQNVQPSLVLNYLIRAL